MQRYAFKIKLSTSLCDLPQSPRYSVLTVHEHPQTVSNWSVLFKCKFVLWNVCFLCSSWVYLDQLRPSFVLCKIDVSVLSHLCTTKVFHLVICQRCVASTKEINQTLIPFSLFLRCWIFLLFHNIEKLATGKLSKHVGIVSLYSLTRTMDLLYSIT